MIDFKRRKLRPAEEHEEIAAASRTEHPRHSHATWVAIGVGGAGIAAGLYGANQQSKANAAAQDTNAASQKSINDTNWANWLLTKGIAPTSPVAAGVMPTAGNYTASNTRLPLWATMSVPQYSQPGPGGPGSPPPAASRFVSFG